MLQTGGLRKNVGKLLFQGNCNMSSNPQPQDQESDALTTVPINSFLLYQNSTRPFALTPLVLDSWGKPESSIMRGNTQFLGNNAECRNVHHTNTTTFTDVQGNMCRMNIYLESFRSPLVSTLEREAGRNSTGDSMFTYLILVNCWRT